MGREKLDAVGHGQSFGNMENRRLIYLIILVEKADNWLRLIYRFFNNFVKRVALGHKNQYYVY